MITTPSCNIAWVSIKGCVPLAGVIHGPCSGARRTGGKGRSRRPGSREYRSASSTSQRKGPRWPPWEYRNAGRGRSRRPPAPPVPCARSRTAWPRRTGPLDRWWRSSGWKLLVHLRLPPFNGYSKLATASEYKQPKWKKKDQEPLCRASVHGLQYHQAFPFQDVLENHTALNRVQTDAVHILAAETSPIVNRVHMLDARAFRLKHPGLVHDVVNRDLLLVKTVIHLRDILLICSGNPVKNHLIHVFHLHKRRCCFSVNIKSKSPCRAQTPLTERLVQCVALNHRTVIHNGRGDLALTRWLRDLLPDLIRPGLPIAGQRKGQYQH